MFVDFQQSYGQKTNFRGQAVIFGYNLAANQLIMDHLVSFNRAIQELSNDTKLICLTLITEKL